jgi:hypothetical protein
MKLVKVLGQQIALPKPIYKTKERKKTGPIVHKAALISAIGNSGRM